jgi:acetylglutamate kinase
VPFASNPYDVMKGLAKYLRLFRGKTFVIKIGGEVLENPEARKAVAEQLSALWTMSIRLVIVHGAGTEIDALCAQRGQAIEKINGRRVTTPEVLETVKMVLAGSVHTNLLAELNSAGMPAVGLSGVDAGLIKASKRAPMHMGGALVDFGEVGDIDRIDPTLLHTLLERDYVPVICPLSANDAGAVFNTNADTVAASIAAVLKAEKLFFVLSAPGLLKDVNQPSSVISFAPLNALDEMIARGEVTGGMLPKSTAIKYALNHAVGSVHLVSGLQQDALLVEVFTNEGAGTKLVKDANYG